jgi:hypothetical protein
MVVAKSVSLGLFFPIILTPPSGYLPMRECSRFVECDPEVVLKTNPEAGFSMD